MCRLRNIAMRDYQETVTTGETHGPVDRQTPDKVFPMCCYASQATQKLPAVLSELLPRHQVGNCGCGPSHQLVAGHPVCWWANAAPPVRSLGTIFLNRVGLSGCINELFPTSLGTMLLGMILDLTMWLLWTNCTVKRTVNAEIGGILRWK